MDIDEVECVVANLIFRKFIKGYISHKSRVVVLAKNAPFPPLTRAELTRRKKGRPAVAVRARRSTIVVAYRLAHAPSLPLVRSQSANRLGSYRSSAA